MRDEDAAILEARATGRSVGRIAREFRTTPEAVNKVLDAYAVELLAEPNLRRTLMLELFRLDELLQTFYAKAKAGDYQSGVLVTRISQRRSCLLGLDPVAGAGAVVVINNNNGPQVHQSVTVEMHGALDDILGVTWRERELIDKRDIGGDQSEEVLTELNALRQARGQRPLAQDERSPD